MTKQGENIHEFRCTAVLCIRRYSHCHRIHNPIVMHQGVDTGMMQFGVQDAQQILIIIVAAWVVRSKAATVCYFWITHSCLI